MEKVEKGIAFSRQLVTEDGRPRLYISVSGEEDRPTAKPGPSRQASWHARSGHRGESKREPAMFFGHHLGKLLTIPCHSSMLIGRIGCDITESSGPLVRSFLQG